jgi:hypothetical protein
MIGLLKDPNHAPEQAIDKIDNSFILDKKNLSRLDTIAR